MLATSEAGQLGIRWYKEKTYLAKRRLDGALRGNQQLALAKDSRKSKSGLLGHLRLFVKMAKAIYRQASGLGLYISSSEGANALENLRGGNLGDAVARPGTRTAESLGIGG